MPTVSTVEKTTSAALAARREASTEAKSPPYPPARRSSAFAALSTTRTQAGGGRLSSRLWRTLMPRSASWSSPNRRYRSGAPGAFVSAVRRSGESR